MNQPRYTPISSFINLTRGVSLWLGSQTRQMAGTGLGNRCKALGAALRRYSRNNLSLKAPTGATASTGAPSETPLRSSQSKCEGLGTPPAEGLQWVLIPIRQTVRAPSNRAEGAVLPVQNAEDWNEVMAFPQDFEWPQPEYIKCSDLAKCGYPHIYTTLEQGLKSLGWTYNINLGRWYPPVKEPDRPKGGLDGTDNVSGTEVPPEQGFRATREGERLRRKGAWSLPDRYR